MSLHPPLTPETRHQIGARELAPDEADGLPHQHRARPDRRRGGAGARAHGKADRRRRARRVRARAQGRCRAAQDAERRAHAASRQRRRRGARRDGEYRGRQHRGAARRHGGRRTRQSGGVSLRRVTHAPHPDRRHRQPVPLARSRPRRRSRASIRSCAWRRARRPRTSSAVARDADAVLVTYAKLPGELLRQLKRCKAIGRFGLGVDNIDLPAASRARHHRHLRAGLLPARGVRPRDGAAAGARRARCRSPTSWCSPAAGRCRRSCRSTGSTGSVLGLVGFGNIPRALAPKAKAFGLRVVTHDPYVSPDVLAAPASRASSFDELLAHVRFRLGARAADAGDARSVQCRRLSPR